MNHFEFLEARIAILEFAFGEVIKNFGKTPPPELDIFFQALANVLEKQIAELNAKVKLEENGQIFVPMQKGSIPS